MKKNDQFGNANSNNNSIFHYNAKASCLGFHSASIRSKGIPLSIGEPLRMAYAIKRVNPTMSPGCRWLGSLLHDIDGLRENADYEQ